MRKSFRRLVAGILCGMLVLSDAGLDQIVYAASVQESTVVEDAEETGDAEVNENENQQTTEDLEANENHEPAEDPEEKEPSESENDLDMAERPASEDSEKPEEAEQEEVTALADVQESSGTGLQVAYRKPGEIKAFLEKSGATRAGSVTYATEPKTTAPYSAGALSAETLNSAVAMLNQIRYIAGLSYDVTLDDSYSEKSQAGSLVNYVNGKLAHDPQKPGDMDKELYDLGLAGAGSSNIAWASWQTRSLNETLIDSWMADDDASNISRLGHRRWCINPSMGKVGFGAVKGNKGIYSAMYAFDRSATPSSIFGVAWPAQNMPTDYFDSQYPWSVSLGEIVTASEIKVKLTRTSDGKVWNFSSDSADGYFNVNNVSYGETGCIIFRPNVSDIASYKAGDVYQVEITKNGSAYVNYDVSFFDLSAVEEEPEIVDSGTINNISWSIDSNGKLTLTGSGDYLNAEQKPERPWASTRHPITSAEVKVSGMTSTKQMFYNLAGLTSVDLTGFDASQVTDMSGMFWNCTSLTSLDLSGLDTGRVTDMSYMLAYCTSLTSLKLDGFDTSQVTDMMRMFWRCSGLTSLDVSSFHTGNVTCMSDMFEGCSGLTSLDISNFDVRNVTHTWGMNNMFKGCSGLSSLDLSDLDTSNVIAMVSLFEGCSSLTSLDLSSFNMVLQYYADMFKGCDSLSYMLTPKYSRPYIDLPKASDTDKWYDESGREYTGLDQNTAAGIVLYRNGYPGSGAIAVRQVFFDMQGHGTAPKKQIVRQGEKINVPETPVEDGYIFTGWYKDAECTENWDFVRDTVEANITLYAGWKVISTYIVSTPTANIPSGSEVEAGTEVSLSTATAGAKIYYTTDGTMPTTSSTLYEDVIIIDSAVTIKAIAVKNGYNDSEVAEFTYTLRDELQNWGDLTEEDQKLYKTPEDIPDDLWVAGIPDNTDYAGKAITFAVRVYDHKKLLTNKTDYTVAYKNNTNAADKEQVAASKAPAVTVKGKGNYSGSIVTYFTINPIDISIGSPYADEFAVEDVLRAYTGKVQKAASTLKRNGKALRSGKDYTISYNAAGQTEGEKVYQDTGTYQVTVTGKGNYTGTRVYYETIAAETLMSKTSVTTIKNQKYTGSEITPALDVKYSRQPLTGMEASTYEKASEEERLAVDYIYAFTNNKEVGTASVTLTGVNGYIGTVTKTFKITGTALKDCALTGFEKSFAYTGNEIEQKVSFSYSSGKGSSKITYDLVGMSAAEYEGANAEIKAGIDYTYEYVNNVEIGTATVTYTGVNGYTGSIKKSYKITGISMQNVKVEQFAASFVYTGRELKQDTAQLSYSAGKGANRVTVPLTEKQDYTATYQNNVKAGTATVTYKGTGRYTGTIKKTYKITAYNLKEDADNRIRVTCPSSAVYAKGGAMPVPVVTYSYKGRYTVLTAGTDYTVSYTNHTAASENSGKTPYIFIQGKGSFSGKRQAGSFTIAKQDLSQLEITVPDIAYKNKANIYKAVPVLTDLNGKKLVSGTDYDKNFAYEYAEDTVVTQLIKKESISVTRRKGEAVGSGDIIPVGAKIKITVTGKNNYKETHSTVFRFVKGNLSGTSVSVAAQYYTGRSLRPGKDQITIKLGKTVLSETDYVIVSYSNNIKKGTAKVTLLGVGNYGGTKTVNFKILDRTMGCLVKFDGNGATSGKMNNQIIVSNIIGTPLTGNQYKRTGYRFTGWNTEKDGSGVSYKNKGRFSNGYRKYGISVTLYAQWEEL